MSDRKRLLLVEDDDVYREMVHRLLNGEFELHDAATGDEALELARTQSFDCALLDYRLPDYTGLALLPQFIRRDCPVIMLTAMGNEQIAVEAMRQGCSDYLVKSGLTPEILRRSIDRAIESRLQQKLATAETRLDRALTGANVGVWDWDLRTNEVYGSPQLTGQLGYGPDVRWTSLDDFTRALHPEDHERTVQHIRDYLDGRVDEYSQTFRLRHQDGTYRWIMSKGAASRGDSGQPQRLIGVHVDITDQKMHEEDTERVNLELQQMCHAASHDLREPIRAITGFTQILEQKLAAQSDAESLDLLRRIGSAARRLYSLIQDMSTYAATQFENHQFEPIALSEVVAKVITDLDVEIQKASGDVICGELPVVTGDRRQLELLFHNLISNAITFRGKDPPRVEIIANHNSDHWTIAVRDNGCGIEPQYQKSIFNVFRRLHHRNNHSGNGIGLALCRRIVEQHRGRIWVESEPAVGSVFSVGIPDS